MKSDLSTLCDKHTRDICPDTLIYLGKVWGLLSQLPYRAEEVNASQQVPAAKAAGCLFGTQCT